MFAALGIASAKRVSPALHVTDAKMDITILVRMAVHPVSAVTGPPAAMSPQVHAFVNFVM